MIKHTMRFPQFGASQQVNIYGVDAFVSKGVVTVVLHELPENKEGVSITNAVEKVATDVVLGLVERGLVDDPATVQWIEHYPHRELLGYGRLDRDMDQPSWDAVELTWNKQANCYLSPRWTPLGRDRYHAPDLNDATRIL